jgi:sRNA-binding regulator protein Hfq
MSSRAVAPSVDNRSDLVSDQLSENPARRISSRAPVRLTAHAVAEEDPNRNVELFYLQKQIQTQMPMVIVLEDDERIEGCIEWYDRLVLKVRGSQKTLVYKSAIKYMYKVGDAGK